MNELSIGKIISKAHEHAEIASLVLSRRMANMAIKIAQSNLLPPIMFGLTITAAARMALAKIEPRLLQIELAPIAFNLIKNHGKGHKVHDMDPHFWQLANDSALELICECLAQYGLHEIAKYISDESIRRHILHDRARLALLDAGYTHTQALSGSHYDFDNIWRGHNTDLTPPKTDDESIDQKNEKCITSIIYLDKNGQVNKLMEGDRIVERGNYIFVLRGTTVTCHTKPSRKEFPKPVNTTDENGNTSPSKYHEAMEDRNARFDPSNMMISYPYVQLLVSNGIDPDKFDCDMGETPRRGEPWIVYTVKGDLQPLYFILNTTEGSKSYISSVKPQNISK